MNKSITIFAAVFAVSMAFLAFGLGEDSSDASPANTFGSDSVGAELIVFDSNGGSGGYKQYVLNNNTVYFPTQYKATGTSNNTYAQITRTGYALMGWSEDSHATSPTYYPGQSYTVTVPKTFYAVWKSTAYDFSYTSFPSTEHVSGNSTVDFAALGQSYTYMTSGDKCEPLLYGGSGAVNHDYYDITLTGPNGYVATFNTSSGNSWTLGWMTASIADYAIKFTGTPNAVGVYEIHIEPSSYSGPGTGTVCNAEGSFFIAVYDANNDPSNIMHVTYGSYDGYGPYHTAIKLPNAVTTRQKGWNVTVDGSPAIFPVGGSFSVVKKETVLTVNEYTFEEVAASGVAGVIAYNANGGFYNGAFAELVPTEGYTGLRNGSLVTKEGFKFLGWSPSGSTADPIYPAGYLYDISSDYTELKAVWGTVNPNTQIHFENPSNGAQNISFYAASGYSYAVPVNGFDISGYRFLGWSETRYDVGTGVAEVGDSITVSGEKTYYAVFEPIIYDCIIHYNANGGYGTMADQEDLGVTSVPHYMTIADSSFIFGGYNFAGWSESRYAESPSFLAGSSYCFTDSGEITLYAVWSEAPVAENHLFAMEFVGNGQSVTNVPQSIYRITTASETWIYIPTNVPQKDGHRFIGWSDTSSGMADYQPGQRVEMTLGEGSTSETKVLYAVWERIYQGGDGTNVTVTFVGDSGTLRSVSVPSGYPVTQIPAPVQEGKGFIGWYTTAGVWDFSKPVTSDMTLSAKYLKVCHLDIDGVSVKVVLDCVSSSTKVTFSDGFAATYSTPAIPAHDVTPDTNGSVTVLVNTENGPLTAVCHYSVTAGGNGSEEEGEEKDKVLGIEIETIGYAVGGAIGILALLVVARRFL